MFEIWIETKYIYPPTQKTTPACRNTWTKRFGKGRHFGVQARALPVDECVNCARIIYELKYCYFGGFR